MWLKGVRNRIPFIALIGLGILVAGCPKKAPHPMKSAEAASPNQSSRPGVPNAPMFQEALSAFERSLVFFDFDRSEIKSQYKPGLSRNANFLTQYSRVRIQIEGHADERGSVQYNLALGDRRANSAKSYLVALGVDGNRISTISFGEERPLISGRGESAWAKNRRAKFIVVGQ